MSLHNPKVSPCRAKQPGHNRKQGCLAGQRQLQEQCDNGRARHGEKPITSRRTAGADVSKTIGANSSGGLQSNSRGCRKPRNRDVLREDLGSVESKE